MPTHGSRSRAVEKADKVRPGQRGDPSTRAVTDLGRTMTALRPRPPCESKPATESAPAPSSPPAERPSRHQDGAPEHPSGVQVGEHSAGGHQVGDLDVRADTTRLGEA